MSQNFDLGPSSYFMLCGNYTIRNDKKLPDVLHKMKTQMYNLRHASLEKNLKKPHKMSGHNVDIKCNIDVQKMKVK